MLGARWMDHKKKVYLKRRPQKGKRKDLKNVGEQEGKQLSHVIPLSEGE